MSGKHSHCSNRSLKAELRSRTQAFEKRDRKNAERHFSKPGIYSVFEGHRHVSKNHRKVVAKEFK